VLAQKLLRVTRQHVRQWSESFLQFRSCLKKVKEAATLVGAAVAAVGVGVVATE